MSQEQRGSPRFAAELEVHYRSASDFVREYSDNISRGGIYVRAEQPLQPGDLIQLHIILPEQSEPLVIEGSVSHVREKANGLPRGMGVEFIAYNPDDRDRLERYIKSLGG